MPFPLRPDRTIHKTWLPVLASLAWLPSLPAQDDARPSPEERLAQTNVKAEGAAKAGSTPGPSDPLRSLSRATEDPLIAQAAPAPTQTPPSPTTPPTQTPAPGQAPGGPGGTPGGPGGGFGGRRGFGGGPGGGFGGGFGGGGMAGQTGLEENFRIDGDQVSLQFPNNAVADILSIYERLTGKTLIKDTNIFEGATISLVTPKPVAKDEAVRLIEASLLTNGYAIVAEPGGQSARILPTRNQGANAVQFSQGVRFYQSPKDIPEGETLVTYFMKLDNLGPEEAAQILGNHVGLSVYGRITPVLIPPGLLITESATIVKQLVSIREAIDLADSGSSLVTKFVSLTYADAATVAQIVQATITAQATERETKGITTIRGQSVSDGRSNQGGDNRQQQQPQQQQSSGSNANQQRQPTTPQPSAQVVADTRLNQVLVVASPEDYTYIASLIVEFDKPLDIEEPFERKLKYASAIEMLPALVDVLKDASAGTTQLPGGGTLQGGGNSQTLLSTSSSQVLAGRRTTNARGGTISTSLGGSTGTSADGTTTGSATSASGFGGRPDVIQGPTEDNAPLSILVNKTRIVADPMSNSIIVIGRKEEAAKVSNLIDVLDRKPAQVYLATVIGQLTLGDDFQFGIDYLTKFNNSGDNLRGTGSFFAAREDVVNNNNVSDLRDNLITSAFGPALGFNVYGQIGDSVEAFLTALEGTNKFKVLSRPSVFALNNKKAVITSGQLIPVPSESISYPGNNNSAGSVSTTVEYRDVVLKLEVVPLINELGEVNLTIAQVNDTVIGSQRVEPNDVPIIGTEQLITAVTVPNGHTVVLGGLISEQQTKDSQGIPFLSRVPVLGNLFKETVDGTTRKELIVFIQPIVVRDDIGLKHASLNEDLRTRVGKELYKEFPDKVVPREDGPAEIPKKKNFFQRMFTRPNKELVE